jgi:DNA mismatch repair ATPase MutS
MDFESHYRLRADLFQSEVSACDQSIRTLAWIRVLAALIIIAAGYLGFKDLIYFTILPLCIIAFFYLVQRQWQKENHRKILLSLVTLNRNEAEAIHNRFSNFSNGSRFVDPAHPYSHDLDLFGDGSLFQYLNRCATPLGEAKLATDLTQLHYTQKIIESRQEAIRELASKLELRQQCWATGQQIETTAVDLNPLLDWLKERDLFLGNRLVEIIRWVLPFITCLSLAMAAINPTFQVVFLFLFVVQLSLAASHSKPISVLQGRLANYKIRLENYAKLFELLKKESFASTRMKSHFDVANYAAEHVHSFSKKVNSLESRMNLIARLFGNGLFLLDFHNVIQLELWRKQHASELPLWIDSLAEWDSLLAFATFHYNHPHYAFAEISQQLAIRGEETGHPLIPTRVRIANSFEIGTPAGLTLITGANMAGKSTFLRAVGVNYVLGLNGSPVCAHKWSSPIAELRTGMRTSDSLQENQSYFYAELFRLQSIITDLRKGNRMVILLDEILKGTNSTDKQTGSRELIKQLIQQPALVMIATHDIALGDMEQQYPQQVANACFEGKIENDQLTFDYTLHQGVAQKANATFLMRKMGIIP